MKNKPAHTSSVRTSRALKKKPKKRPLQTATCAFVHYSYISRPTIARSREQMDVGVPSTVLCHRSCR